ncbi:MAG: glycoside hydrolase family 1 protein [Solirubrobacteraceae bacterium]
MRRATICLAAVLAVLAASAPAALAARGDVAFPRGFLWGTANAGFQYEAGGSPSNADRGSDWWAWSHDPANIAKRWVTGDRVERSAGHWRVWRTDLDLARRGLGSNAYRTGIEWSRIFPRSTAGVRTGTRITLADLRRLDRLADHRALAHYRAELAGIRARGMRTFLTLDHFTLPRWIHDPIATRDALARLPTPNTPPPALRRGGWLDPATVTEFRKYAAYLAWKLGDLVDWWTPLNEPLVVATNGYVNVPGAFAGYFPPGAFNYAAVMRVLRNLIEANRAAYDAVHAWDRRSSVRGGPRARVGLVQNMIAFTPADPRSAADQAATRNADYLFNRLFPNAAIRGWDDRNADGVITPDERRRDWRGKADFLGVNYYTRGRVKALGAPLTPLIPVLDFLPTTSYRWKGNPSGAPCPTTCTQFGWEIYPQGLFDVLRTAGSYRLPVYITENGIADSTDSQRPSYLVRHLLEIRRAIRAGVPVKGYFHWSLVDNFEWSSGFYPRFGLYRFDPRTLRRTPRPSARLVARIYRENAIPADAVRRYGAR